MNWNNLVRWLQEVDGGSIIHKSLTLRSTTTKNHDRGLFASDTIHGGDILMRIPLTTSINGKLMPCTYEYTSKGETGTSSKSVRNVSPWLRCLAALIKELRQRDDEQPPQSSHYLDSLPHDYETLWKWSNREIDEYLAGTRPPDYNDAVHIDPSTVKAATTAATSNPWMILNDPKVFRQQFEIMIRPYLIHCGILDVPPTIINSTDANEPDEKVEEEEYELFQRACQIMSTRSFYNMNASDSDERQHDDTNNSNVDIAKYDGPYLLPIIDLINHADTCTGRTNTKLEFTVQPNAPVSSYYFVMRALHTIPSDTEILHSYGDELSNYQFLSSFGCIPINRMTRTQYHQQHPHRYDQHQMQTVTSDQTTPTSLTTTTSHYTKSVVVTKQEIWEACWNIIESGLPQRLATSMIESKSFDPDETWTVTIDKHRTGDCVPDSIVIVQPSSVAADQQSTFICSGLLEDNESTIDSQSILSDELVTAACIPFLPKCAYAEITSRTLLDASILQDYYLGQLVGTALLQMIQRRLLLYRPIHTSTIQRLRQSGDLMNDKEILHSLLRGMDATNDSCDSNGNRTNDVLPVGADLNVERCRLAYGLTIRLEEKEILNSLANTILQLLNSLNRNVDNDDTQFETGTKKFKTSEG